MGRPRVHDERNALSIRMDPGLYKRLSDAAEERDVSLNWLVCRLLTESIDRLIPVSEILLTRERSR